MITINFYNTNSVLKKISIQKLMVQAVTMILFSVFIMFAYWGMQQIIITYNKAELKKIEGQVKALAPETTVIQSMKQQTNQIKNKIHEIDQLRASQFQVTEILENLILPIPDDVWLTSIKQIKHEDIIRRQIPLTSISSLRKIKSKDKNNKKIQQGESDKYLEVQATVLGRYSDKTIIDYLDYLRETPIFNEVLLHKINGQLIGVNPVREFIFFIYISSKTKL